MRKPNWAAVVEWDAAECRVHLPPVFCAGVESSLDLCGQRVRMRRSSRRW